MSHLRRYHWDPPADCSWLLPSGIQCGCEAGWIADGNPLCDAHAARYAVVWRGGTPEDHILDMAVEVLAALYDEFEPPLVWVVGNCVTRMYTALEDAGERALLASYLRGVLAALLEE